MIEKNLHPIPARMAATILLTGSICMLAGAVVLQFTGTDLDTSLYEKDLAGYLLGAQNSQALLILNLTIWILGVILLGAGVRLISMFPDQPQPLVQLIRYTYTIAIPLVVVSYMAWMAVVVRVAHLTSPEAAAIADSMGWFAVRADWLATVLVLGVGPALISQAGKNSWVPGWLRIWSLISLFAGILNVVAQYTGGLTSYGFIIIPVGMGWMIATSVVLFRKNF